MTDGAGDILTWALRYHRLGWTIIPAGYGEDGKRPPRGFSWKRYQTERPSEADLERWFAGGKSVPAVVLGGASGGLVCRDFDDPDAFHAWALEHRELAETLPTVETGRGYHTYLRAAWEGFIDLGDEGELRGDVGHYCILPPAVHKSGKRYAWIVGLPETTSEIPLIDPFAAGLALPEAKKGQTERRRKEDGEATQAMALRPPSVISLSSLCLSSGRQVRDVQRVGDAIERTLPDGPKQRNRAIFGLARRLKGIPEFADLPPMELLPIVREWHRLALPAIGTKGFGVTLADFLHAWESVRFPVNAEYLADVFSRAEKNPVGDFDDPNVRVLAAVCRELQADSGDKPFFLAVRDAGGFFGFGKDTGSKLLKVLEALGYIEVLVKGGTREHPMHATRFRYLGPGAEEGGQDR